MQAPHKRHPMERALESGLFLSRWLMAPFYVGLVVALGMLLVVFVEELVIALPHVIGAGSEEIILVALTLIDLSLAGNLVLIVVFSGYENFVSKINIEGHEDRPSWMGTLDFSGLKIKLVGSIVAISAISLLRAFMTLTQQAEMTAMDETRIFWLVMLHLTFVSSGVLFALMDWVASFSEKKDIHGGNKP
ncbi:MAG: TIGR00645 family protein [Alphaproteobacteria bacterium]|nr:TIGR00645 family protein [Alphaproteobacteria bacterium]